MKEVLTDVEILHKLLPEYKKYDNIQVSFVGENVLVSGYDSKDLSTMFTEYINPIKYCEYIQYDSEEERIKNKRIENEKYNKVLNVVTNLKSNYYQELRNRKIKGLL